MLKQPLNQNHVLFYGSALFPYLLDIIPRHSAGVHSLESGFLDFVALIILAITTLVLVVRELRDYDTRKALTQLATAVLAVVLYFYSLDFRLRVLESVIFYPQIFAFDAHVARLNRVSPTADSLKTENQSLPEDEKCYISLSGIVFCPTDGEASIYQAGYAYSPDDKRPLDGEYDQWYKLIGHWYRWKRRDG